MGLIDDDIPSVVISDPHGTMLDLFVGIRVQRRNTVHIDVIRQKRLIGRSQSGDCVPLGGIIVVLVAAAGATRMKSTWPTDRIRLAATILVVIVISAR